MRNLFFDVVHRGLVVLALVSMSMYATAAQTPSSSSVYVDLVNYNHDHNFGYTLIDKTINPGRPISGGAVWPLASGGSVNCCLNLPDHWRPGIKILVKWDDYIKHDLQGSFQRILEIPRYEKPSNLYVVFNPKKQPELVISRVEPGHPDWPGSIKQTPWDYCIAQHGRKECKAALPHQFDKESAQGYCLYRQQKTHLEHDELCEFTMLECMKDYEDEVFCKKILWEPGKDNK